jgi:hypothetical protein
MNIHDWQYILQIRTFAHLQNFKYQYYNFVKFRFTDKWARASWLTWFFSNNLRFFSLADLADYRDFIISVQ